MNIEVEDIQTFEQLIQFLYTDSPPNNITQELFSLAKTFQVTLPENKYFFLKYLEKVPKLIEICSENFGLLLTDFITEKTLINDLENLYSKITQQIIENYDVTIIVENSQFRCHKGTSFHVTYGRYL